ncbi:MAG: tRNA lysidine(34) synthetase TilS [Clostridiales bacterium]|jgi:tRNA(Ile)-lysidine synthase|nr:tRNA lysidine(34) synthetase TilS [Clostridiales bacterium]
MLPSVLSAIQKYGMLSQGDRIIAGLSGGADSVCLLIILLELRDEYALTLRPVHVHHGIRGREADEDASFARALCAQNGLALICFHMDVPALAADKKMGLEEAGRFARYDCFQRAARENGCAKIAVGHNRNDNAETILMRLCRGAGLKGLCGVPPVRKMPGCQIIRPLIETDRRDIERYLFARGADYRRDSTNESGDYTRNIVRRKIIPMMAAELHADVTEKLNALGTLAALENDFMEREAEKAFDFCRACHPGEQIFFSINRLKTLHPALISRVIRLAIARWGLKDISMEHAARVQCLLDGPTGKWTPLPGGLTARRVYDLLEFLPSAAAQAETNPFCYDLNLNGRVYVPELHQIFTLSAPVNAPPGEFPSEDPLCTKFFRRDKMGDTIQIRSRRPGDRIRISSVGDVKIKDYFINTKTPRGLRDSIGLIARESDILWILDAKNIVHAGYVWRDGAPAAKCCLQILMKTEEDGHEGNGSRHDTGGKD